MSNLTALSMPKWGMAMEEGEIGLWRVDVGGNVTEGDELIDIESSKIVNTVESPVTGVLVRQIAQVGETLVVGALLGVVASGDASDAEIDAFIESFDGPTAAADAPAPVAATAPSAAPAAAKAAPKPDASVQLSAALTEGPDDSGVSASNGAKRLAAKHNINLNNVTSTGSKGRVSKEDVELAIAQDSAAASTPAAASSGGDDSDVAATPVARKLAKKLGVNLNDVTPTGARGRISKEDVEKAAAGSTPAPAASASAPAASAQATASAPAAYEDEKLGGMRKTIAARLSESKQTIPHYRVSVDIEIDNMLAARKQINNDLDLSVSVNDFIVKACASALQRVPEVNVQFNGDSIRRFSQVDISIAVAIDGGLITPVIRDVASKGLETISVEAKDLASRAQSGQLGVDEFQGGTFSISNLGMFGVDQFDAIINLPQAAILAVGAGKRKAVVKDEEIVAATVMRVSLSSDHRAIDGAVAARFLQVLKGFLENPASMLI